MITFQNDGLLDLRAIKTFGVSAKDTSHPIGFFGTGLKYAIAILCRLGHPPRIWVGLEEVVIGIKPLELRGKAFSVITMNGEELGFTTELGKTWDTWQAFRELYCNALDEHQGIIEAQEIVPAEGKTTIQVATAFDTVWSQRDLYLCMGIPDWVVDGIEIHKRPSTSMFSKGIKVGDLNKPADFTYNFVGQSLRLTEDRSIGWYWEPQEKIAKAVLKSGNDDLMTAMFTASLKSYESEISYVDAGHLANREAFLRCMESLPYRTVNSMSAMNLYRSLSGRLYDPDPTPMDEIEKQQLQKSIDFLVGLGYPVNDDHITVTADLPEQTLGCVWEGRIFLSRRVFNMGTKQVAITLFEEHLHLRKNFVDETREFQDFLITMVITYAERMKGGPL